MKKNEMAIVMRKQKVHGLGDEWKVGWKLRIDKKGYGHNGPSHIYYIVEIVDTELNLLAEPQDTSEVRLEPLVKIIETNADWVGTGETTDLMGMIDDETKDTVKRIRGA